MSTSILVWAGGATIYEAIRIARKGDKKEIFRQNSVVRPIIYTGLGAVALLFIKHQIMNQHYYHSKNIAAIICSICLFYNAYQEASALLSSSKRISTKKNRRA